MPKEKVDKIYYEMGKHIFTEKTLLETEMIEGAFKTKKKLSKTYDIYIITARTEPLILHVKKWLKKNHLENDITKILSSSWEEKQNICLDYNINFLCDDDKRHLKKHSIQNRILFNPFNTSVYYNSIEQVKSWVEIEEKLMLIN